MVRETRPDCSVLTAASARVVALAEWARARSALTCTTGEPQAPPSLVVHAPHIHFIHPSPPHVLLKGSHGQDQVLRCPQWPRGHPDLHRLGPGAPYIRVLFVCRRHLIDLRLSSWYCQCKANVSGHYHPLASPRFKRQWSLVIGISCAKRDLQGLPLGARSTGVVRGYSGCNYERCFSSVSTCVPFVWCSSIRSWL